MVATVGSISIDLAVKSAAFEAGFKRAGTTVERESARMSKATAAASKSIDGLSSVAARFGGAFAGALAGREIVRYADAWTEAGNKIRAAGEVAGRQGRTLRELNDIATETRSGLNETVDLYAKMLRATGDVAKSEEEVARATELVNKAFKAGGAAASEQAAGILQLSQALGSGVLQGDELRSLRENAPLVAAAIAKEFNTTVAGLKELGAAGELTSERVFKAILAGAGDIEAAFAKTEATIGDGLTRIKNASTELIGTLSEITGGAGSLAGELNQFGAEIERTSDAIARFANDPSIRSFFEDLLGARVTTFGTSPAERLAAGLEAAKRPAEEIRAEIEAVTARIKELEEAGALGPFRQHLENAKADLAALNAELEQSEVLGHGAFAALARSAEDASMKALEAFREVSDGIQSIPDKTVTINVRTVQTGNGAVGVTSLGGVDQASLNRGNPISNPTRLDPLGGYATFAGGGFTGNAPENRVAGLVHGGEFVFDAETTKKIGVANLEAIRRGVRGYQEGGAVGAASILTSGRDKLSAIDDNTFETAENTLRAIGYLETLVDDGQAMLRALGEVESAIGAIRVSSASPAVPSAPTSAPSESPAPAAGGGSKGIFGSSSGGTGTVADLQEAARSEGLRTGYYQGKSFQYYDHNDSKAPYRWNWSSGVPYDPLADFTLNGNYNALDQISSGGGPISVMNATGPIPDIKKILLAQGPSMGAYGGGYTFSAGGSSDFLSGTGRFGGGFRGGFYTGGMIHPGDTQPVQFFKRPDEAVGVFRPEQMAAIGQAMSSPGNVAVHYHAAPGNPDPSPRAMMELRDQVRQTVLSVMAGL